MAERRCDLALPGQIEIRQGQFCSITISELSRANCRIRESLPQLHAETPVQVWLGAIGPLRAHVSARSLSQVVFDGEIHAAIVEHFNA